MNNSSNVDFSSPRLHVVLNANGGFIAATVAEAATVRASEAHASQRERKALTKRAVRTVGVVLVDAARPSAGAPILLTHAEARSLATALNGSRKRNRMAGGRNSRRRRA